MKYGLIGEKLIHSFSKELHSYFGDYEYELEEIAPDDIKEFFTSKDFCGINVTIPYKSEVIKYLDFIDDVAMAIGAVNTVVNRGGKLYGYNTDAYGLTALINSGGISLKDKKVLILGSGGTSKTALFVAKSLGAKSVFRVSRTEKCGVITYDEAVKTQGDADIIINTTPCGMFPNIQNTPIDINGFSKLSAVVDVIYNPLKSRLCLKAIRKGIKAVGGLYMLVAQGYKSAELFFDTEPKNSISAVYEKILSAKRNIVLIGMPSSGKTTIGKMLSEELGMPFFDSDEQITLNTGRTPADIIKNDGEPEFRRIESEVLAELSAKNHCVIATGGGAVTVEDNIFSLQSNGKIYFIDRPCELLISTPDRPLSSSKEAICELYSRRKNLYENAADVIIKNDCDIQSAVQRTEKDFYNENFSY